jgi:predicted nucleic acid-binding protein
MPDNMAFIDTNILLYLLSADTEKADRAEKIPDVQPCIPWTCKMGF